MVFFRRFVAGGVSVARVVSSGPRFEPGSVLPAPSRPRRRPAGSAEASSIASFAFRFGLCAYHGASARARPPSLWDSSSVLAASASRFAASSSARSSSANRLTCADEARDCVSEPRFRARSVSIASLARAPASSRAFASARSSSSATRWRCFHPYGFQLLCGRMFSPPWPPIGRDSKSAFAPVGCLLFGFACLIFSGPPTFRKTAAGGPSHSSARSSSTRARTGLSSDRTRVVPPGARSSGTLSRDERGGHHEAPHAQHARLECQGARFSSSTSVPRFALGGGDIARLRNPPRAL